MNVQNRILNLLSDLLGIDTEIITLNSHLVNDLGAESIDFIDICYQIEKIFKIPKVLLTDIYPEGVRNEKFTNNAMKAIIETHLYIKDDLLKIIINEQSFSAIWTVRALIDFVEWKITNESE